MNLERRRFLAVLPSIFALTEAASGKNTIASGLSKVKFRRFVHEKGYCEGPTWLKDTLFFCSDGLLRVDSNGRTSRISDISPAGTASGGKGFLFICDNKHRAILRRSPKGELDVMAERFEDKPLRSLNDLSFDSRGNLYWTDPVGSSLKNPEGHVFRLRPNGKVEKFATGLAFPNGLDVDPAGEFLYVVETLTKKVLRYKLHGDGPAGKRETVYDLGGNGGDGCAFDAEGNLWVADSHRPDTKKGRVIVISPAGKFLGALEAPVHSVTNVTFGGLNHDEIFCTVGEPNGVLRAAVGVKGFAGHPAKSMRALRRLSP